MNDKVLTAGAALVARLGKLGIEYLFCNSGTDFPPIIEGLAAGAAQGLTFPRAIAVPHEHAAMGMAHGYYFATGRSAAVMLHTNVGLANGTIGAINAACDQVPVILMSGRTPTLERGRFGARTVPIGWGQEMRDQTALVREACKWDYELRFAEQVPELLDRAHAIAHSTPPGPVYLSLPREVLCEPVEPALVESEVRAQAATTRVEAGQLEHLAALLTEADKPLVIAQRGCGSRAAYAGFAQMVEQWAIPVCQYWAVKLALDTDHSMYVGVDPAPWLRDADLVIVLDSLAPWSPAQHVVSDRARIVQLGPDPLFSRFPARHFPVDLALAGETAPALEALANEMQNRRHPKGKAFIDARRERIAEASRTNLASRLEAASAGAGQPMSKTWVSARLSVALEKYAQPDGYTVLSELGAPLNTLRLRGHHSWYQEPHAGGLGWSFAAALGIKLADPRRLVIATMGDGSYLFSNPAVCHHLAAALELPILILVLNNAEWGAVRDAVLGLYPDGYAARSNQMPLTSIAPNPDFCLIAKASGAYAERVCDGAALDEALRRAIECVIDKQRAALLDLSVGPGTA